MVGNDKRMNPADSAGTDGAIEGQSPAENSTNTASLLVWWQLFVSVWLFFATRVAWDAVFVEFSAGL